MSEKTLLLVDGSSYLYRAFHALPDLRNKAGEPTGAIYGMVSMLRRLRTDGNLNGGTPIAADLAAVVFDAPGKTFRDELYADYKANRKAMPEDLAAQIPAIHALVRAMGWPLVMVDGIEADDVIGTLAQRARALGIRTVVSTGDKDLAQLVDEHTTLVNTMTRDGAPPERLDREAVIAKFGVPPERIVDWLTLVGDAVDNVPGVDKVGPKTAVKLIAQYGSLEGVIANADKVPGVVGQNLVRALEWLPTARTLVTVRCDCELRPHVESVDGLHLGGEDLPTLAAFFERYGLRSFLREVQERIGAGTEGAGDAGLLRERAPGADAASLSALARGGADGASGMGASGLPGNDADFPVVPVPADKTYECITTTEQLEAWMQRIEAADLVSVDTETTSLDPMAARIVGVSLAVEPGHGCYVPLAHDYAGAPEQLPRDAVLARLKPWLEDASRPKVGQNLKYDEHVLQNHGIRLAGVVHDTLLQSYVLEPQRTHDMDALAMRHLERRTVSYDDVTGKGAKRIGFEQVALDKATEYAAEDAEVVVHLHRTLWPRIEADDKLRFVYQSIEMPVSRILQRMERAGILVDGELLAAQSDELGGKMHALEQRCHEAAGGPFNMGSPKQIGELLFDRLKLPVIKKTASGAPSTDEEVLAKLAQDYPLPKLLLEWRTLSKLKSTYTDKLPRMVNPDTGRVHTNFSQATAVTGRLSSTEPNLQNIPVRTPEGRRIREAFVAPPDCVMVSADYSQVELRIMAHLSADPSLMKAFGEGSDVHRHTAGEIFGVDAASVTNDQRRVAKTINFGLIYGMSQFGLAAQLGIERDAARLYIERYFAQYPGVARYMAQTRDDAKARGYVETVFGRRLYLPEINSPNGPRRQAAERAAINAPLQGTAADIIKLAMIAVQGWLDREGLRTRIVLQVHDELVLEVPNAELDAVRAEVPGLMAAVAQLAVPLQAELGVGGNWDEAH